MKINKGDYVRDMAGNISRVECVIDYKRNNPTAYLLNKGVVIYSNDTYLEQDVKYAAKEKIIDVQSYDNRYQLIVPGDYIFESEVIGKLHYCITLANGHSKYIDLIKDVPILTKEKIEENTIIL